jgi:DNA-binding NtrC family response regulator
MGPGSRRASGELVRAYDSARVDVESEVIAHGERSRAILYQLGQLAPSARSVLICGETGTGKTKLAQLLHSRGPQASRPLRVVNCAALSDALLADLMRELDDARQRNTDPGTLFLDEIGELSPWGQAVLLHRLQSVATPTRFVAATHRDLDAMALKGGFSRELINQLGSARITLSPLRARREEIVPLALHFLRLGLRAMGLKLVSVVPELFQVAERYDWPGNVRELENAMRRALAINESGMLEVADLPDAVRAPPHFSSRGYSR